jgi:hypothetical protein
MGGFDLREFLSAKNVPDTFEFLNDVSVAPGAEPIRIRGTLQAGNAERVYVLVGAVVLEFPAESVVNLTSLGDDSLLSVEISVLPEVVVQARSQFLLLDGQDNRPLILRQGNIDYAEYDDPRHQRDQELLEKLRRMGVPISPLGDDGGTRTYSYLSSATTKPDAGTDSDPIRIADD